jgi:hypothetical protein
MTMVQLAAEISENGFGRSIEEGVAAAKGAMHDNGAGLLPHVVHKCGSKVVKGEVMHRRTASRSRSQSHLQHVMCRTFIGCSRTQTLVTRFFLFATGTLARRPLALSRPISTEC